MGKHKQPPSREPTTPAVPVTPFNNPFGALSKLRDGLPALPSVESRPDVPASEQSAPSGRLESSGALVVQHERKGRAGKTVTRVGGVPAQLIHELAPRLKAALGCGATVEGEELVLLGALGERAAEWLRAEGARQVIVVGGPSSPAVREPRGTASTRDGSRRAELAPGLTVDIVLKSDQRSGALTRGVVLDILSPGATHPHGIKVRLTDGRVGRVKRVC